MGFFVCFSEIVFGLPSFFFQSPNDIFKRTKFSFVRLTLQKKKKVLLGLNKTFGCSNFQGSQFFKGGQNKIIIKNIIYKISVFT